MGMEKRNYLVTAVEEEEIYYYECSKFDRDGIICCHIREPGNESLERWVG